MNDRFVQDISETIAMTRIAHGTRSIVYLTNWKERKTDTIKVYNRGGALYFNADFIAYPYVGHPWRHNVGSLTDSLLDALLADGPL